MTENLDALIVVRFSAFGPTSLENNARSTHQEDVDNNLSAPRFGVSVLAENRRDNESIEAVVDRICLGATMSSKTVLWSTGQRLLDEGFIVVPDPTEKDPNHCLVGEGDFSEIPRVIALSSILSANKRDNPRFRKAGS